ncbi:MAG: regulatory protein RecX [Gammaproteobacteria bacterium]|nr:regulatory protein RecX [Gammaproteobacteria bacterium]MBP6052218.1 regulatory protein RecX [Pseudomonadales bacterium]MBK7520601.1 regulatory protein RecX [Gammaproteobacteria bacterium]MBK7728487.1 regulatory protein RecX [Gammaproteobacteria bacterium]MBK9664461.1 regulatory protein RecX [Gammaproteobacteria bacterium]
MNLLARREYAPGELRARLVARFGSQAPIDPELERLAGEGLLSESRYIEAFVRMHRNRGHGPLRILRELERRGVEPGRAEAGVEPGAREWYELARAWRLRRFGAGAPASAAEWQKQSRHLQQRGFSGEHIRHALRDLPDDAVAPGKYP